MEKTFPAGFDSQGNPVENNEGRNVVAHDIISVLHEKHGHTATHLIVLKNALPMSDSPETANMIVDGHTQMVATFLRNKLVGEINELEPGDRLALDGVLQKHIEEVGALFGVSAEALAATDADMEAMYSQIPLVEEANEQAA